ncbi:MAG: hypothetical protein LBQ66_03780 [Planctomycetaceae bacterium]|nr:hypothetical protein [Planctomycetaceae bacterium]
MSNIISLQAVGLHRSVENIHPHTNEHSVGMQPLVKPQGCIHTEYNNAAGLHFLPSDTFLTECNNAKASNGLKNMELSFRRAA